MRSKYLKVFVLSFLFLFSILLPQHETSVVQAQSYTDSCVGKFYGVDGDATATVQVAKSGTSRTLQWGLVLNPSAQSQYGSEVKTTLTTARVAYADINPPYTPHTEEPSYNFHGSLKNYQFLGKSGGGTLKVGDRVFLLFILKGSNGAQDKVEINCTVE
ncbi:MAG: hypothetical protein ABS949_20200 [Solibacillus sp.]